MFAIGTFHAINAISENSRAEAVLKTVDSLKNAPAGDVMDEKARFPSTASPSVELIFGAITLAHSVFGIVSVTQERANFLATYSHILLISCFIKMLFLIGK